MAKRLQVPPDLEKLIEKREDETGRRSSERRKKALPKADVEAAGKAERRQADRRKKKRRKGS